MYYIRHFCVYPYDPVLKNTLETEYQIYCKCLEDVNTGEMKSFVFDVSDLHPKITELNKILPAEQSEEEIHSQLERGEVTNYVIILHYRQYSESERRSAKWLEIGSKVNRIVPVNRKTLDGIDCFVKFSKSGAPRGAHEFQREPYVIKGNVKWGRHAFLGAEYYGERLFCNDTTRAILTAQNVNGMQFLPVLKNSSMQPYDNIFQLDSAHIVPDGAIVAISEIGSLICPQCGMHMLQFRNGRSRFGILQDSLDENIDFWATQAMFIGAGPPEIISGHKRLIISQRMYRILRDNHLDRGLDFIPIEIVQQ